MKVTFEFKSPEEVEEFFKKLRGENAKKEWPERVESAPGYITTSGGCEVIKTSR